MNKPKILKLEFSLRKGTKIAEFELVDYSVVLNVKIHSECLSQIVFSNEPLTAQRLTKIFKFFTNSDFSLKEYLDYFEQYGFYTILHPNLNLTVRDEEAVS